MGDATEKCIVDAVLDELSDRSFDAAALKYDDPEVYADLHAACVERVKFALRHRGVRENEEGVDRG